MLGSERIQTYVEDHCLISLLCLHILEPCHGPPDYTDQQELKQEIGSVALRVHLHFFSCRYMDSSSENFHRRIFLSKSHLPDL